MPPTRLLLPALLAGLLAPSPALSTASAREVLHRTVDLRVGESAEVAWNGDLRATVALISLKERLDPVTGAVREARVTVTVNGEPIELVSGTYHLPKPAGGFQIDCPVTAGYRAKGDAGFWGLDRDARLRLWPKDSPWIEPGTLGYPVRQKWFATDTQMANEPVHVDGGEKPGKDRLYYHSGLDIGGSEGLVEVIAATDGLVVSSKTFTLPEHRDDSPVSPRYDVVYLLDDRGWYYRYSHLKEIAPGIKPGARVRRGDLLGTLGKEGGSGGWTHLHFEIKSRQPSGKWGTEEGYAFLWEACRHEQKLPVIAVARPHHLAWTGDTVRLDGSKSWAAAPGALTYEWRFGDGTTATGPVVERRYETPGRHSEILRVTDAEGRIAYDFAVVIVYDRAHPDRHVNTLHPNHFPTLGIRPGDPVTFKVRSFIPSGSRDGEEIWDFGDGSPKVAVRSDGNAEKLAPDGYAETVHRFERPGDYVVRVQRTSPEGVVSAGHLWVRVDP